MNEEVQMTLDEAVAEVLALLTGIDLEFQPERDRYQTITRQINRALRAVAREQEWSYYSSVENLGTAQEGTRGLTLRPSLRPRIIADDAVRLVNPATGNAVRWAYFQPRDALSKHVAREELYCSITRTGLEFSRPLNSSEANLEIHIPVMREPVMFRLPQQPEDPEEELVTVSDDIREQLVDFDNPDLVIAKAAFFYAQTHPILQPRVMQLDDDYKTILYALQERDERHTAAPFQNNWQMDIFSDVTARPQRHQHPHTQGQW